MLRDNSSVPRRVSRPSLSDFSQSSHFPARRVANDSLLPSGDRLGKTAFTPAELRGRPSPLIRPVEASNGSDQILVCSARAVKASFLPSGEIARLDSGPAPVVRRSGPPIQRRLCGSTSTLHRFFTLWENPSK